MIQRRYWNARRWASLLAAGMLLQVGGCTIDLAELTGGLINTIATQLIGSVVFGAFNLVP